MAMLTDKVITVEPGQMISLPVEWWGFENLTPGEQIVLSRLSDGLVQARRPLPTSKMSYDDILDAFGDLLRRAGYNTRGKVLDLVKEIKSEVAEEWQSRAHSE